MNARVKVGLDEWLVADASKVDLITDGLSGCVAVGLAGNGKVALSHVFSDCKAENWDAYKAKLDEAFAASDLGARGEVSGVLVCSQNGEGEGSNQWLPQKLQAWLAEKGVNAEIRQDAGCRISATEDELSCTLKKDDRADDYRYGYKISTAAADDLALKTGLSKEAKSAGPAHPPRGDRDYDGPKLDSAEHPANGLYRQILGKIPKEAVGEKEQADVANNYDAKLAASALTVQCLKAKITAVDSVVVGGDEKELLFAVKGTQKESMQHVSVNTFDAAEVSPTVYASQARTAHDALPTATATQDAPARVVGMV